MVRLRSREQTAELSSPLIISPEYVRGSYKWLQDHENKIENNLPGSRCLEFYELFSVDGARKGTQPKLCAPWFQHYTTDDLCSVPIHTMAADFKQQYKQLPCVVSYLQKEVRCNSSHPDLGCVCGTASCFAPNLWLEGKDKPGREKLSVAHAMLDVSIINNKRGIFERRYLYLPVARCYEFIGNKLHFETNLDLGPQDKPLMVFLPKSDGSGWVTHTLQRWCYQRTQYGIYEHMARHLKRMELDLFPAVPDAAAAPEPAAAAAAAPAPPAAASAAGQDAGRKAAAHRDKPAPARHPVSTGRSAARAADVQAQEAAPASKVSRLSVSSSSPAAARAAAAGAAGHGGSRPHTGRVASASAAGGSRPLRSRAQLPAAVPAAGTPAGVVAAAATDEADKPAAADSPTPNPAPSAATSSQVHGGQAAREPAAATAGAGPGPTAAAAAAAPAAVSAENAPMPVECAAQPAAAAAATAAAVRSGKPGRPADLPPKLAKIHQTQQTDTTSSESGVLTCAADAAAAAAARQMASSSEPTDCWAALSAMLQPTLAAQETVFSSAQHKQRQDCTLAEGGRMVCT